MESVKTVLTSEFFGGVIVGLILSFVGSFFLAYFLAYFLAVFDARQQRRERKDVLKNLCADTVTNLHQIVDDMDLTRSKDRLSIHGDYLLLLDVEINAFSRNREHLAYLPASLRNKIRQFVTDCAIGRAELGTHLAMFSSQWALANEWQARGGGPVAQRARDDAMKGPLTEAHKAVDRLVHYVSRSSDLVKEINAA